MVASCVVFLLYPKGVRTFQMKTQTPTKQICLGPGIFSLGQECQWHGVVTPELLHGVAGSLPLRSTLDRYLHRSAARGLIHCYVIKLVQTEGVPSRWSRMPKYLVSSNGLSTAWWSSGEGGNNSRKMCWSSDELKEVHVVSKHVW